MPRQSASSPRLWLRHAARLACVLGLLMLATGCETERSAYALTSTGQIIKFKTTSPDAIDNSVSVSGLGAGQNLVQLAFRPSTQGYYGVTNDNRLATVNPESGAASVVSAAQFTADALTNVAIAFDPANDQLRLTASSTASPTTRENLRIDPGNGALLNTSTLLFYDGDNATHPQINGLAYTGNTTLYGLDVTSQKLVRIGSEEVPSAANADGGVTVQIGAPGISFSANLGMATAPGTNDLFAVLSASGSGARFYNIDPDTGVATLVGPVHEVDYTLLSLVIAPEVDSDSDSPF